MTYSKRPELPASFNNFINEKSTKSADESTKKKPLKLFLTVGMLDAIEKLTALSGIDTTNWIRAAIKEKIDREDSK